MMDRVRALKIEHPSSGGTDIDEEPNSLNPNEDFLDARGVSIQNDISNDEDVVISRNASGDMTFVDRNMSTKTLSELASGSGMTEAQHRDLDQLVHELDEDYYEEYTRTGNFVTNITTWSDATKTKKIREEQYTYSGRKVTQEVRIQYDATGVETERLTISYNYSGWRLQSATAVRT